MDLVHVRDGRVVGHWALRDNTAMDRRLALHQDP